jgi:hypothetical protein
MGKEPFSSELTEHQTHTHLYITIHCYHIVIVWSVIAQKWVTFSLIESLMDIQEFQPLEELTVFY